MLLESVQMLATALIERNAPVEHMPTNLEGNPYRTTHKNHPCTIWTRATRSNFLWLIRHARALAQVHFSVYGTEHRCAQFLDRIEAGAKYIPDGELQPFANCSLYGEGAREVYLPYQQTMIDKWRDDKRTPKWTNRAKPDWV